MIGGTPQAVRPGDVHRAVFESERDVQPDGGTGAQWQRVCTVQPTGWCDCVDFAMQWPVAWLGTRWRLLLRTGNIYTIAASGTLPALGMYATSTDRSGIVHRIRGQYHDEVILEMVQIPAGQGRARLVSWARSGGGMSPQDEQNELAQGTYADEGTVARISRVVHSAGMILLGFQFANLGSSDRFLQWFSRNTLPPNGTVPADTPIRIAAGGQGWYFPPPRQYLYGLAWASSSTFSPLTLTLSADLWVTTFYRMT